MKVKFTIIVVLQIQGEKRIFSTFAGLKECNQHLKYTEHL